MSRALSIRVCDSIDGDISAAQWDALFADHPDSRQLPRLTQQCGMDGFEFRSAVVRDEAGDPLLLLPLFIADVALRDLADGVPAKVLGALNRVAPRAAQLRMLGIGFVEGEWGAVGVRHGAAVELLEQAWKLALRTLPSIAAEFRSGITLFLNFVEFSARDLPADQLQSFARIATYPCGRLRVDFNTLDGYLETLAKATRKNVRRKMREAATVKVEHTQTPTTCDVDRIHELYRETVERSAMSFGVQRRAFFERICNAVPGAEYVFYRDANDVILAFNLLVHHRDALVDKYFGMTPAGRELNLYFVSWLENVRMCIERKIPVYHAGPGAEETKARLGAELLPTLTMFRHRNLLAHALLARMKSLIAYTPTIPLPSIAPGRSGGAQ